MMGSLGKLFLWIFLFSNQFLSLALASYHDEVVYGEDGRRYGFQHSNTQLQYLSRSVAAVMNKSKYEFIAGGKAIRIFSETLEEEFGLCEEVAFAKDRTGADCSSFLVAPDLVATAGHCVVSERHCGETSFIFDFNREVVGEGQQSYVSTSKVYHCQEIVARDFGGNKGVDFAIVRLNRPVKDRLPLQYRNSGEISLDASLAVIGHPGGLPKVITMDAKVMRSDSELFFSITSDTFAGNSGSPVINQSTGLVEGILIRGENDYRYNENKGCFEINVCPENGGECEGEEVMRMTQIGAPFLFL